MDGAYHIWGLILGRSMQVVLILFLCLFMWSCRSDVVSLLQNSRAHIRAFCANSLGAGEKQEKLMRSAADHFLEWRLAVLRRCVSVMLPMLSVYIILLIFWLHGTHDLYFVFSRAIFYALLYTICVLLYRGTIPFSSGILDVLGIIYTLMYCSRLYTDIQDLNDFNAMFGRRVGPTSRALVSVVYLKFSRVAVANVFVSACDIVFHALVSGVFDTDWLVETASEIYALGCVLILAHIVEAGARLLITQRVEAKTSTAGWRAVGSILSVLCDAVVHLGCDLTILNECPQLGHLLMSGIGSCHKFDGGNILRYVVDEDKSRFEQFIKQQSEFARTPVETTSNHLIGVPASAAAVAGPAALHISLKDAMGTIFRVEVIHAYLPNFDEDGHLLGIRDLGDNARAECVDAIPEQLCSDEPPPHEGCRTMSSRSSDSDSFDGQSESQNERHAGKFRSLILLVDALNGKMPIRAASLQCQSPEDEEEVEPDLPTLSAWLSSRDSRRFRCWAQDAGNCLHYGDAVLPYGRVELRPFGSWLKMKSRGVSASTDEDTGLVRFHFEDVDVRFSEMPPTNKRPLPCIRETSGAAKSTAAASDVIGSSERATAQSHGTPQVVIGHALLGLQSRLNL